MVGSGHISGLLVTCFLDQPSNAFVFRRQQYSDTQKLIILRNTQLIERQEGTEGLAQDLSIFFIFLYELDLFCTKTSIYLSVVNIYETSR